MLIYSRVPLSSAQKGHSFLLCGTEGILLLNRGVFGVELRDFWWWKGVVLVLNWGDLCGTEGICVELRGTLDSLKNEKYGQTIISSDAEVLNRDNTRCF